jgi:tRNA/rRNA methyltransferase
LVTLFIILVKPAVPANVGAAARAMKTMGISSLRLVNPCDYLCKESRLLAHASNEILESAEVFSSLEEAIQDMDFVIGTTSRRRTVRDKFISADDIPALLTAKGDTIQNVAIVFGCEESGLSNQDASLCHTLSCISMATRYPSLNLAQAVMIYAYELSVLSGKKNRIRLPKQNHESWLVLRKRTEGILSQINMPEGNPIRMKLLERLALLEEKDIYLLHSITNKLINQR